ncbi:BCSC C-terminal domain-containing protein [Acetobacter sp. TBRC 12305]|nr:cellulose synthase subunit BcsC-related outer membrane protein [Acetobacter garciniae]MBX0345077.1 BCSC C-terminal domain-containing protein [Acetobacter garciniae]
MSSAPDLYSPDPALPAAPRTVRLRVVSRRERKRFVLLGTLGAVWSASLSYGFGQTPAGTAPAPSASPVTAPPMGTAPTAAAPVPAATSGAPAPAAVPWGATPVSATPASGAPAFAPASAHPVGPAQPMQGQSAENALFYRLISEAEYWLSQHQFDRAQDSVERALDMMPHNPQALLLLGTVQKGRGDVTGAEKTLALMQNTGAPADLRSALRDIIDAKPVDKDKLAQARALAASGKMLPASLAYKALFGNGPPPPDLALEYYSVLGSTILGYQEAIARLQLWLQRNPADLDAQLLYYRVLTYRETSRPQGLEGVKKLASADISPRIRRQAYAAWRQTLLWEPIRGSSIPLYYEWLAQHPTDAEIADRLEKSRAEQGRIDADTARVNGFSHLNAGHVEEAGKEFQQALAYNAHDAAALGGMGLVAERQRDWRRAEENFRLAMAADPATASQWRNALVGVRQSMAGNNPLGGQIARAIAADRNDDARRYIAQLAQEPGQQVNALLFRAQLELREGHRTEAEEAYRAVLSRAPRNKGARSTLVTLLLQDGQLDEAEDIIRQSDTVQPELAAQVQSARLVQQASRTTDGAERVSLLRDAVNTTPADPWVRLKLAQALAATHHADEGQAVMNSLLDQPHPPREALAAAIIYADGQNDFATSEALLRRMPPAALSPDMHQLMERAQAGLEVDTAERNSMTAVAGLKALASRPDPSGQRTLLVADALLRHDEVQAAYEVLKQGQAQAVAVSASQRLSYAGLYLRILASPGRPSFHRRVRQDIVACLSAFDAQTRNQEPTDREAEARSQIEDGFMAIRADDLVRRGWPDDARHLLAPYVATHPDAIESRLAMARALDAKDMPERALAEDLRVLQHAPQNTRVLAAAVHDATMADDTRAADALAERLHRLDPDARETWSALAESAQSRDNMHHQLTAMEHVQAADCADNDSDACDREDLREPDYRWPLIEAGYQDQRGVMLPDSYHYLRDEKAPAANNRSVVYLTDSVAPQMDANFYVRNRTGIAGLGQLTELALPITGSIPFESWNHRVSFSISPTFLFTGNPLGNDGSNHQFGQCATVGTNGLCTGHGHHYYVQGVGLNVNYVNRWFSADVGSTPLGFPIANVVGGLEFAPHLTRDLVLRISGGRRMVTNSELSYAGMKDPVSGKTWGGVTRDYGHGMLEWGHPGWNLYAGGGFAYLDGTHVRSNTEFDVEAGGSAVVWQQRQRQAIRTGLDFTYYDYRRNDYLFTWGQGGYFSPQGYYAIMVPLEWTGHQDEWTWLLRGEGGFQHYHSDAARYFPLDQRLQLSAIAPSTEGAQSASGVAGNVQGRVIYQVTPSLRMGAQASYSRAGNWSEISAILMAHYTFDTF